MRNPYLTIRPVSGSLPMGWAILHNIKPNLFFAFAYNAAGIPVAAWVVGAQDWSIFDHHD